MFIAVAIGLVAGGVALQEAGPKPADPALAKYTAAADYSKDNAGRAMLVMVKGKVVFERADNGWSMDRPHPLASGTKSFVGVMAAAAVQDGLLSWDELAADTLTEWKSDDLKSKITVRHLLSLASGLEPNDAQLSRKGAGAGMLGDRRTAMDELRGSDEQQDWYAAAIATPMAGTPGGQFRYGPSHFYAFCALFQRKLDAAVAAGKPIAGKTVEDYLKARVLKPAGVEIGWMGHDKAGHPNLAGGALLTPKEWAEFGEFVRLQAGVRSADGTVKHIIDPALLAECFKPSATNPAYGLTWWLPMNRFADGGGAEVADGGGAAAPAPKPGDAERPARERIRERLTQRAQRAGLEKEVGPVIGPDGKPVTVYMAAGLGKQRLYVIPDYDMVVVRFAEYTRAGADFSNQEFLGRVLGVKKP